MKIKIIAIFIIIIHKSLIGQCVWDNNKGFNTPLGSTINTFDWRTDRYLVYTKTNQTSPDLIWSPFSSQNNADDNINGFIVQFPKDNDPSEGWELILKNFGSPNDPYPNPTLVLYNRYSAILRVFIYVPQLSNFDKNSAKIDIMFYYIDASSKVESALLAPLSTPLVALDKFKKKIASSAIQRTKYQGLFWMYADFPVNYDPCTCKYLTAINVKPNLVNIQEVNLLASVQKTNLTTNGSGSTNFISSVSHALDFLAKGTEAIKKRGTQVGTNTKDASDFLDKNVLPNFSTTTRRELMGPDDDAPYIVDVLNTYKVPEILRLAMPQLGQVFGAIEYLATAGKATAVSASNVNYEVKGSIIDSIPGQHSIIYLPGSKWIGDPNGNAEKYKPIYNNALGTFTVLETPKINFNLSTLPNFSGTYPLQVLKYKLDISQNNPVIKYFINSASGLKADPTEVKGALIVKLKQKLYKEESATQTKLKPKVSSLVSSIIQEEKGTGIFIIQTPLMSLDCIKDIAGTITGADCEFSSIEFRLQVVATMERSDNSGKKSFFSAQYLLNVNDLASLDLPLSSNDISYVPVKSLITDLNLTADKTIRAWDDISIKGNVKTNGFKLTLIAGNTVNMNSTNNMSPDIDIKIESPGNCSNMLNPATSQDVSNFCASSKYNPIIPTIRERDEEPITAQKDLKTMLNVVPNPFENRLVIHFTLQEESNGSISLTNSIGQVIKTQEFTQKSAGEYDEIMETNDVAPGVYYLTLQTKFGVETKKIVKQL
jgi:Secretion system C-terminal sorting domain